MATVRAADATPIDFMGAKLEFPDGCLASEAEIKLTWHRTIAHAGALSSVYDLEVPEPYTFQKDPWLTISTTSKIASESHNVIGFMVPGKGLWIPETYPTDTRCPDSTICGPVQSQTFQHADTGNPSVTTTNVLRLAVVTRCSQDTQCPSGQSCKVANACQQCPENSCE